MQFNNKQLMRHLKQEKFFILLILLFILVLVAPSAPNSDAPINNQSQDNEASLEYKETDDEKLAQDELYGDRVDYPEPTIDSGEEVNQENDIPEQFDPPIIEQEANDVLVIDMENHNTSGEAPLPVNNNKHYLVDRVVDGDTIRVLMEGLSVAVRLIGVDTPESVHPTKQVECFGMEASNIAKEKLTGQRVILEIDPTQGDKDKYGRLLRYVFLLDGQNFNKWLIAEGYAYEYTHQLPYKYQIEFKDAQFSAQQNQLGLWAPGVCETPDNNVQATEAIIQTREYTSEATPKNDGPLDCLNNIYNCTDFLTQAEAQAVFDQCYQETKKDIHKLDADGNLRACERLP